MNPIAVRAEHALGQHAHSALRLSELVELIGEGIDRALDAHRLRAILEGHPDRFRILDPWRGPWRTLEAPEGGPKGAGAPRLDVWVVGIDYPIDRPDAPRGASQKLRESVRWLGRGIDPRSPSEVSRWYGIALAERAVRVAVARPAA